LPRAKAIIISESNSIEGGSFPFRLLDHLRKKSFLQKKIGTHGNAFCHMLICSVSLDLEVVQRGAFWCPIINFS